MTEAVVPSVVHVLMPQGTQGSTLLRLAERLSERIPEPVATPPSLSRPDW